MSTFDVERQELTAFAIGNSYFFTEHIDHDDLCNAPNYYHNSYNYRFEIPYRGLDAVRQIFYRYFNDPVIADKRVPYCVVLQRDADATSFLRGAVTHQVRGRYRVFLMKDRPSLEQVVEQGVHKLTDSQINGDNITWQIGRS
jgi:hypothetical protein